LNVADASLEGWAEKGRHEGRFLAAIEPFGELPEELGLPAERGGEVGEVVDGEEVLVIEADEWDFALLGGAGEKRFKIGNAKIGSFEFDSPAKGTDDPRLSPKVTETFLNGLGVGEGSAAVVKAEARESTDPDVGVGVDFGKEGVRHFWREEGEIVFVAEHLHECSSAGGVSTSFAGHAVEDFGHG
jgi:hypothetical protein